MASYKNSSAYSSEIREKCYSKIAVTDFVILMDHRLKMPSMDWNIIWQILSKIAERNFFALHFGIVSQEIMLDYNYFSQNIFFIDVIYWISYNYLKILLWWCAAYYLDRSVRSNINVWVLYLVGWGSKEYFSKSRYDMFPEVAIYPSRTLELVLQ